MKKINSDIYFPTMFCFSSFKHLSICVLFIVILFTKTGIAQIENIKFQAIKHGLSNPHVKCICKDSKGFMWFGTSEGLNKFDGSNFTLYVNNTKDSTSLVNNNVNSIFEDTNNNLWIGTTIGLSIYNREKDNFEVFKDIGSKQFSYITSFLEDKNGNIWIGSSGDGLFIFNPINDSLYTYRNSGNDRTSISSNYINSILAGKNNEIWLATDKGLELYDIESQKFIHFENEQVPCSELQNSLVKKICFDNDGNLWAGTYGNGLFKLVNAKSKWSIQSFNASGQKGSLTSNDILSLTCDQTGNLWIGTENGGLNVLTKYSNTFHTYKTEDGNTQSISSNSVWSLYQDNTGIVWIGTFNHGLNFYDERIEKFNTYQRNPYELTTLLNNNVVSFSEDQSNNLWIATDGGGISSFNLRTRKFTNKLANSVISSKATLDVLCDSKQRIWVATWGGGLDLFDHSGSKIQNYKLEALDRPGNIMCLLEDNSGQIWVGTHRNGLLVYDAKTNSFEKVIDQTSNTQLSANAFVNSLFQDADSTIWIGVSFSLISITNRNGEKVFTEYKHSNNPQSISSFNISTIFEDSKNDIWVGTDDGLNLLDKEKGTFTIFRKENGLPNNTINGIIEDKNYCLWLSTYGGISKFDIQQKTFKNYSIDDGFLSNSFNPRAYLKTRSGEFFFGNNSGFISFFPDSINMNTFIPPVYFTSFKTFNDPAVIGALGSPLSKNISETKQITLDYKQTSFTIGFVALNFTHAAKNQYAYKLEGFDEDWNYVGTKQYATYTNIDAGKYTFKVRGSNNEGIWNPDPVELEIKVLSPFWSTNWAYSFYVLCFVFIIWSFIKLLVIKSKQAEKLKLEKIHHEKSEELNTMKIQFFANVSHEFRTPLSLIIAPLKQLIEVESLKENVKERMIMVYNNANKLFSLVNELMDFTKSEEGRLKIMVQKIDLIVYTREIYNMFLDESKQRAIDYRYEPTAVNMELYVDKSKIGKIISNLLSNAFKYTPDNGKIVLKIERATQYGQSFAKLSVIDNGSGIAQEYIDKVFDRFYQAPEEEKQHIAGTGIGLAFVKSLAELHHGTISVQSEKWKETCFTLKIPFGNAHFNEDELLNDSGEYFANQIENHTHQPLSEEIEPETNAPTLLIVEDNAELRAYLASTLSPKYHIVNAIDGFEGLKMARELQPDLILSDISMPRLSGIELCRTIKNEMATSHIPIILLTAKTSTSDKIEGIETGADAYITKPFDIQHLEVTIQKTIETRRKLYRQFSQDVYIIPNENSANELDRKFLENIVHYIDTNASDDNITVENLAAHLLMSRTNVYRKIKALTGQTATEFIRVVRLKMSIKLIETGRYNISEIAFKVGFSSPGYFAKCFKDQYGKSPSDFIMTKNKHIESEKP
ncbi:MAG: two-component regulator propeller domain-containing protein [Prolixibacteraceae bacterium]